MATLYDIHPEYFEYEPKDAISIALIQESGGEFTISCEPYNHHKYAKILEWTATIKFWMQLDMDNESEVVVSAKSLSFRQSITDVISIYHASRDIAHRRGKGEA